VSHSERAGFLHLEGWYRDCPVVDPESKVEQAAGPQSWPTTLGLRARPAGTSMMDSPLPALGRLDPAWFVGGVLVAFHSYLHFNTRPTSRWLTSVGRYHATALLYTFTTVSAWIVFVAFPGLLGDLVPEDSRYLSVPRYVSLALTVLLPDINSPAGTTKGSAPFCMVWPGSHMRPSGSQGSCRRRHSKPTRVRSHRALRHLPRSGCEDRPCLLQRDWEGAMGVRKNAKFLMPRRTRSHSVVR